jgi:hypothetical protein
MIGNPMSPEEQVISKLRASSFDIDDDKRVTLEDYFHSQHVVTLQLSAYLLAHRGWRRARFMSSPTLRVGTSCTASSHLRPCDGT